MGNMPEYEVLLNIKKPAAIDKRQPALKFSKMKTLLRCFDSRSQFR